MEKNAKVLLNHSTDKLKTFRTIADLIHLTEKDIDEMEKNPKIVKIVSESLSALGSSPNCTITKDKATSNALIQAVWDKCKGRTDAAAEELMCRLRRANHEHCKKSFLLNNSVSEADWKMLLWFQEVCKIVGISIARYKKMATKPKMMKMISDIARKTALKYGFSEVFNEEENREPKLKEQKFQNELSLSVLSHVTKSNDPLVMDFRNNIIGSANDWIDDCESSKTIEAVLEQKDPTVVYNGQKMRSSKVDQMNVGDGAGDVDKNFEDRNKDLKSLEEGFEEEIGEESEGEEEGGVLSFLSSMLERLRI
uniref:Skp1 domain-containing protein n=1 Tax=Caenorhabditis tropicalis TaxID=1561998 RepID=A0A1I7TUC2_9PELO